MRKTFFFVKPHPPRDILRRRCPLPENYRYDWEPLGLKYLAWQTMKQTREASVKVWHLMDERDDRLFLAAVLRERPTAVFFTELDILVNQVNILAGRIKAINPAIVTVVGGKQSSLLKEGDHLPFRHLDYIVSGDGARAVPAVTAALCAGTRVRHAAIVDLDPRTGRVRAVGRGTGGEELARLEPGFREIPVENHPFEEYAAQRQRQPNLDCDDRGTAPILVSSGCPYSCVFCQTPLEADGAGYVLRDPALVAEEIVRLARDRGITNLFSLESNMHLDHWRRVYDELEKHGIASFPVSGFIRTSDLAAAVGNGLLRELAARGLRFVHCGLDVVLDGTGDVYRKNDSVKDIRRCLDFCLELGVVVIGTYIGNPEYTAEEFGRQLEEVKALPIADIDIRLAVALRNTEYFTANERRLVRHPDRSRLYYDRQNYRYQTIRLPGKIKPRQTYALVRRFYREFHASAVHLAYVRDMVRRHGDTLPWFTARLRSLPGEPSPAVSALLAEFSGRAQGVGTA